MCHVILPRVDRMPSSEMAVLERTLEEIRNYAIFFFLYVTFAQSTHLIARDIFYSFQEKNFISHEQLHIDTVSRYTLTRFYSASVCINVRFIPVPKATASRQDLPAGEQWHAARALFRQRDGSVFG